MIADTMLVRKDRQTLRYVIPFMWFAICVSLGSGSSFAVSDQNQRYDLNITQPNLGDAAEALAKQTGLELLFPFELAETGGINPVVGTYSIPDALSEMLRDTGFSGSLTTSGVITIYRGANAEDSAPEGTMETTTRPATGQNRTSLLGRLLSSVAAVLTVATATPDSQAVAQQVALEEIVVTARKRDERLIDIPLSVQAFSAADLSAAGIDDLEDLTLFSPGLDYNSQSSTSFTGRYIPAIRFRGLTTVSTLPSNQVGSLFVDGVFVLGGAQSIGFEDVERVEIIKGPQAAFFGRSTFGGAINYITADPADEFGGKVSAEYSPNHGSYRGSVTVEGPLVEGLLSGRLTASGFENGGYETANDGGTLGEETTDAVHASLLFTPSETVRIKVRASYIEDEDSQPAVTTIQFFNKSNCAAGTPLTVLDASGASRNVSLQGDYWCGGLPEDVPVTANTTFPVFPAVGNLPELDVRDLFVGNSLGIDEIDRAPFLDHFGLRRQTVRLATTFDVEASDAVTVSGSLAYNDQKIRRINDQDYTDAESVYIGAPSFFEDYSGEIRAQYDDGGKLRGLIGTNYYKQKIKAAFGNAIEATNQLSLDFLPTAPTIRVTGAQNSGNNDDKIRTFGIFGSLEYDILDNLTATLEGRWQNDKVTQFGGQFLTPGAAQSLTSKKFLPRAILSYRPMDDMTTYVSYSQGTLPGQFNGTFINLSAADKAIVQAQIPGLQDSIPPEKLESYEIGLKQSLLEGRATYALAAYMMDWTNMKSAVSFIPPGATGLQGALISGTSEIKGVEFEANWLVSEAFDLGFTANYTDATYNDFAISGVNQLFGLSNAEGYRVDGNTLPAFPKWSGSLSGTYTGTVNADWDWYTRADVAYQGKAYADPSNINWVKAYTLVNLKVGIENEGTTLEFFANNLFDETGWASGTTGLDLGVVPVLFSNLFVRRGAVVTALRDREVGVRATWSF